MRTIAIFDTEEELLGLTGLRDHDDLLNAGFDLDDWDFGVATNRQLKGKNHFDNWLLDSLSEWYCGYSYVAFEGMHFYIAYHA